ncbi:hypothetical protein FHS69_000800 [Erythrobacter flavus]|nr:hypothetical protein [Qipengyuania flava]
MVNYCYIIGFRRNTANLACAKLACVSGILMCETDAAWREHVCCKLNPEPEQNADLPRDQK